MAEYDHHGNLIPSPRHRRAEIKELMKRGSAVSVVSKRIHPREYEPAWAERGWEGLTDEERLGFDLEQIHKNLYGPR